VRQPLAGRGARDEARAEQDEIRRLNAQNADVGRTLILLQTASEQQSRGKMPEAIPSLRQAVAISPAFAEAHYQLGLALGRTPAGAGEAERAFRDVLRLNPDHALAHYQLGLLLVRRGDTESARAALERAAALAPGLAGATR